MPPLNHHQSVVFIPTLLLAANITTAAACFSAAAQVPHLRHYCRHTAAAAATNTDRYHQATAPVVLLPPKLKHLTKQPLTGTLSGTWYIRMIHVCATTYEKRGYTPTMPLTITDCTKALVPAILLSTNTSCAEIEDDAGSHKNRLKYALGGEGLRIPPYYYKNTHYQVPGIYYVPPPRTTGYTAIVLQLAPLLLILLLMLLLSRLHRFTANKREEKPPDSSPKSGRPPDKLTAQ